MRSISIDYVGSGGSGRSEARCAGLSGHAALVWREWNSIRLLLARSKVARQDFQSELSLDDQPVLLDGWSLEPSAVVAVAKY